MGSPETIFALATPLGRAGVAVIRISGSEAFAAAALLCGTVPKPRQAALRTLRTASGEVLDEALVISFVEGRSFTGESVVELQTHGSVAVVDAVLQELGTYQGLRLAEPGEFTRRAFENGQLDLVQVEGLAELIEAETEEQRRRAQDIYSGSLSEEFSGLRARLLEALALSEAQIDFSDEEIPDGLSSRVMQLLGDVDREIHEMVDGASAARGIAEGFQVAIVGPPNSGKSSLFNKIMGKNAAIVTDVAGTTRDVVEGRTSMDGLLVTWLDTAGLRETDDKIEREGVMRARRRALDADLRVFLRDGPDRFAAELFQDGDLEVVGKADLRGEGGDVSSVTGVGVDDLLARVKDILRQKAAKASLVSSRRQEAHLLECLVYLGQARDLLEKDGPVELVSDALQRSVRELEIIVGRVDVEDMLGQIFSSFCIGK